MIYIYLVVAAILFCTGAFSELSNPNKTETDNEMHEIAAISVFWPFILLVGVAAAIVYALSSLPFLIRDFAKNRL